MRSIIGLSLVVLLAGLAPAQSVNVPDNYGAVYPTPSPVSPVIQAPVLDPSELPVGLGSDLQTDGPILLPFPVEPNRSVSHPGVVNPDDPIKYIDVPPEVNKYALARPGVINHDELSIDVPPRRSKYSFVRPGVVNPDDKVLDIPPSLSGSDIDRPAVSEGRFPLAVSRPGLALDVRARSPFFRDRIALAFGPSLIGRSAVAELYDASGRMVLRSNLRVGAVSSIDDPVLRKLPVGSYLLRVSCDCGPEMYRTLKTSKPLD